MAGIRERFGKGMTRDEKLADSNKALEAIRKNLVIALGVKDISEKAHTLIMDFALESQIQAHCAAAVRKAEAEKRAAEAEAKRAEMLNKALAEVAAKLGTTDPAKLLEAIQAAAHKAENKAE